MSSEIKPQRKLNLTIRSQADVAHNRLTQQAECSACRCEGIRLTRLKRAHGVIESRAGNVKIRAVENIEDLGPELEIHGLVELEPLA